MSKPVLFVSFRPLERAENLHAIYEAYTGDKVHMLSSDVNYLSEVQSGKYNLMVTDDFPYVSPGKTIVIWHGIHGGKTIGLSQPEQPFLNESISNLITYVISASSRMVYKWSDCTGVPKERILPLGFPRTDEYVEYIHEPCDQKRYLFVPTFRDRNETVFPNIDWQYLDNQLADDEKLFVKAHPWQTGRTDQVTNGVDNSMFKHIEIIPPESPTTSYLYMADVVITDYSSIMFDAYLLNKPVVLFEKTTGYTETRGMCFRYPEEYCSFFARTELELLDKIRYRAKYPYLMPNEELIKHIVADRCDGHACERLVNLINEINK